MNELLRLEHIQKIYGNGGGVTRAIDDISFSVSSGEFLGIMGASGSGIPMARPMAVHAASAVPVRYATPGSPIRSQLLMSDASALMAVTNGPNFLPPR